MIGKDVYTMLMLLGGFGSIILLFLAAILSGLSGQSNKAYIMNLEEEINVKDEEADTVSFMAEEAANHIETSYEAFEEASGEYDEENCEQLTHFQMRMMAIAQVIVTQ